MNRFVVWSTQLVGDAATDVVETRRSERKVAEEDVSLMKDILHRKAWVQDTEID